LIREGGRLFAGREVLVIDLEGVKHGPIKVEEGLALAKEVGLNLVMVAENANPQVCRIMDFGKLQYERKKKIREQKKHHHAQKLKEVKFRLRIEKHDYDYKINHAIEFLEKGYKLKATMMFRGREMAHKEFGFQLMKNVVSDLVEHGKAESDPKLMGRNVSVTFTPVNNKKG
jgi:translation initiation factor IF-3